MSKEKDNVTSKTNPSLEKGKEKIKLILKDPIINLCTVTQARAVMNPCLH